MGSLGNKRRSLQFQPRIDTSFFTLYRTPSMSYEWQAPELKRDQIYYRINYTTPHGRENGYTTNLLLAKLLGSTIDTSSGEPEQWKVHEVRGESLLKNMRTESDSSTGVMKRDPLEPWIWKNGGWTDYKVVTHDLFKEFIQLQKQQIDKGIGKSGLEGVNPAEYPPNPKTLQSEIYVLISYRSPGSATASRANNQNQLMNFGITTDRQKIVSAYSSIIHTGPIGELTVAWKLLRDGKVAFLWYAIDEGWNADEDCTLGLLKAIESPTGFESWSEFV
ncbi:hypothetical protein CC78DRAFT_620673 [Lojkania enalia]|uniref:Uncharacterized protein n=1 Tax=Lojkania enalia TaxID=147567 RepID=A0A9P4K0W8_9PLEO|nr:hypothetical protein CC78DRAFT_620673 [Didymosphaeria enalia]